MRLALLVSLIAMPIGCSDSNFRAGSRSPSNALKPPSDDQRPNTIQTQVPEDVDIDASGGASEGSLCWVAVSGGYFGFGDSSYQSSFPQTQSGQPITHGATFDPVGGVYLNARNDTYEYGKGAKEIDLAIDKTFDSIAITPGVKLKVWNQSGQVVLDRAGPAMMLSKDYEDKNPSGVPAAVTLAPTFKDRAKVMPEWMQKLMIDADYKLPQVSGMHTWKKVLVTRIQGTPCR